MESFVADMLDVGDAPPGEQGRNAATNTYMVQRRPPYLKLQVSLLGLSLCHPLPKLFMPPDHAACSGRLFVAQHLQELDVSLCCM